ncbi:MAG: hypothetical protein H0V17_07345 [Deltaproteobacteria bacterium]|nr:hypothetical protein [Deltaproteobacteria bacterium]
MRPFLVLCLIAGCADGTSIEVRSPDGVDVEKVELFIGTGGCTIPIDDDGNGEDDPCPGIGPPGDATLTSGLPGEVFHVDSIEPFTSASVDGAAYFRIESAVDLPVVIAVGTGADGVQNSVAILKKLPADAGARRVVVQLEQAGNALTKLRSPTETRVSIWPDASPDRDGAPPTCVGAEVRSRRVFVVPEDDLDCDAVIAADECNALVHLAQNPVKAVPAEAATCTYPSHVGRNATEVCMIGDQACDESMPGTNSCNNLTETCISNTLCASCPTLDEGCVGDLIVDDLGGSVRAIACKVVLETDVNETQATPCSDASEQTAQLPGTCLGSTLSPFGYPFAFADPLVVATGSSDELQLSSAIASGTCGFGLVHAGSFPPGTPPRLGLWAKLVVSSTREVLLPVIVTFDVVPAGMCPQNASICGPAPTAATTDRVLSCLEP